MKFYCAVRVAFQLTFVLVSHPVVAQSLFAPVGVENPQRAWQHWTLNCQGCHLPTGLGSVGGAPNLSRVAQFLWVPGGREYLARVPGVAASPLGDADLAEVLNWMLWRFDKEHMRANFRGYTAAELQPLRRRPLRMEASTTRTELLKQIEAHPAL